MAGAQKEFELLFKLKASLSGNFNSTFKGAIETQRQLQNSLKSVNSMQSKVESYTKTSSAIEQQKNKLTSLQQAHEKITQKIQLHQTNVERLQAKIEETGDATGELTALLVQEQNEVDKSTERLKNNENQIRQTNASIERSEQNLQELGDELREAGINTDNLEESNTRLQRSYERLQSSQQTLRRLNQAQQNISESISRTKTQLVGTVGAMSAVAAAVYAGPIKTYQDFEEEMSKVAGITGATGDELEALKNAAKQAGQTTWATATESAQALEYMSLAGWTGEQSIGALNSMLQAAKISGLDLGASTDLVTDSMSAMGISVDQLGHYLDVTVKANNVANTSSNELMEAILGCAGAAKTNGMSLESLSTALAVFGNNGLKGTQAGTAMNSILVRMTSNDKALSEMARLGVNAFDKQTGSFRNMGDILKDLEAKMSKMTDAQRDASLKAIAGTNYYSQFAYLLDSVSEAAEGTAGSWDVLTDELNNADKAAEEMYGTMMNNFSGAMTEAKSAIEAVQLALGEALTPALTGIVRTVTPYIQQIATFISEHKEVVATVAKVATGLGAAKIAFLGLKIAGLSGESGIISIIQKLVSLRAGFIANMATATSFGAKIKVIGSAFGGITGKILPIVGVITAAIAVFKIVKDHLEEIRSFIQNTFGDEALAVFDKIVAVVTNVGEAIKGVFSDGNLGAARDKINEIFGEKGVAIFDTFAGVFQRVIAAAGQFVSFVNTNIVPVVEQVLNVLITTVIPGIISGVQSAAPVIMQIIQATADFIGAIIPIIGDFIAGIMPVISEVISFIQTQVFPVVGDVFNFIVSTVLPFIAQGIQQLGAVITEVLSAVLPIVQNVFQSVWNIVQPILSGIIQFITGVFSGDWSQAWEGIKTIFSGVWDGILAICKGVINGITSSVNVVIRGLNTLKVPDWIPGIGGKSINIPEIPQLAKGSKNTPSTFIAGEKGPELITNAPGRTVYTAQQTKDIFSAQNTVAQAAGAGLIASNMFYSASEAKPLEVISNVGQQGSQNNITITNSPTIYVDSDKAGDFETKMEEANRNFLQEVENLLDKRIDDERRTRHE